MMNWLRRRDARSGLTSIGIQPDGLCLARIRRNTAGRPVVSTFAYRTWDRGDIQDRKALSRVATEFKLKRAACTTVLDSGDYKLLLLDAPAVPADELRAAIRWRIKDLVDFNTQDAVIDVFELPGVVPVGSPRSIYATVAQKQVIQQRIDWMEGSGVNLRVIDIPELAQRNIAALLPEDADGVVMLSLHNTGGLITVTKSGQLYFSRNIDSGLDAFRQAAHPLEYFDRIVLEAQRSLDYCDSHYRDISLGCLVIAPLPVEVAGLTAHLSANLSIRVLSLDLTTALDFESEPPQELLCMGLTTLGSALRQERIP